MRVLPILVALVVAGCATPEAGPTPTATVAGPSAGEVPSTMAPLQPPSTATTPYAPAPPSPMTPTAAPPPSRGRFVGCSGSGPVTFNTSPMREQDFADIVPYGLVVGGHVTPIDHMYFAPPPGSQRDDFEVRAIADGVIYEMGPRDIAVEQNKPKLREWRMDIAHTCTFTSYFDLLTSLDPAIEAEYNATRSSQWRGIPVRAGQVVGRIGAQTLDFGVYDYNVTLAGFVLPEHYEREPWKVHTVNPFPYFEEPIRAMLLAKDLRQAEPRAGKIDHDVDGTAQGNWFAVGTNWYAGDGRWDYWDGHLAIAPDHIDPTHVRFSVGNYSGQPRQFSIRGEHLDPAAIGVETGLVEWELAQTIHYERDEPSHEGMGPTGVRPGQEILARASSATEGVALVQLIEPRLLKVEVFPGKSAADVDDFTPAARLYER